MGGGFCGGGHTAAANPVPAAPAPAAPAASHMATPPDAELARIRGRLQEGRLTADDIKALEAVVVNVENAVRQLRASIIE